MTKAEQNSHRYPGRRDFLKYGLYTGLSATLPGSLFLNSCAKKQTARKAANIILISIDTLRADHLGCYGYSRDTSPNIDRFVTESIRFANAYAPTPWTLPSHAAMLTGIHPFKFGMDSQHSGIPENVPFLAENLKEAGYQTVAFVDSMPKGFLGADRGFARGFYKFYHAPFKMNLKYKYDMSVTVDVAKQWLRECNKSKPFFLFLHTKSTHVVPKVENGDPRGFPYDKPDPYRSRYLTDQQALLHWNPSFVGYLLHYNTLLASGKIKSDEFPRQRIEALKAQYDASIYYTDEYFGKLLKNLDEMKLLDNTIIVFTADHGEAFLEHRFFLHNEVYKQLMHVPLIIRLPAGCNGRTIKTPVGLEDITPTILSLVDVDIPEMVTGEQLPMTSAVNRPERQFYGYYQFGSKEFFDEFSLMEGDWKLVYQKYPNGKWQSELYNIAEDPEEQSPITAQTERRAKLHKDLLNWMNSPPSIGSNKIMIDPETIKHLKSLGYVN
jgi:arylsulfatase A-like enzyme